MVLASLPTGRGLACGWSALRPGVFDLGQYVEGGLVQGDPIRHAGPKSSGADSARHLIRRIEADNGAVVGEQLIGESVDGRREDRRIEIFVCGDPSMSRNPCLRVAEFRGGQICLKSENLFTSVKGCCELVVPSRFFQASERQRYRHLLRFLFQQASLSDKRKLDGAESMFCPVSASRQL